MIRWEEAWRRAKECNHSLIQGKNKADFRSLTYVQTFANIAAGTTTAPTLQTFTGGAFVLEVTGAAAVPQVMKPDQYYADGAAAPLDSTYDRRPSNTPGNMDLFGVNLQYTNDEILTPGGPGIACALFGINGDRFPARELLVDPSQGILCQVSNLCTFQLVSGAAAATGILRALTVHIVYKCMVPRNVG